MGRGTSKAGGNKASGPNGLTAISSVTVQSGDTIQLDSPLMYGSKDAAVTGRQRELLEEQEAKRLSAKIEYGQVVGDDRLIGSEYRGGKDSVHVPFFLLNTENAAFTHNHPRGKGEEGCLGGTFSEADLDVFANRNLKTFRASAAEGTYSITKTDNFKKSEFKAYKSQVSSKAIANKKKADSELADMVYKGKISYNEYLAGKTKNFNNLLVEVHNGLLAGQKQYGYNYTLEGR